jgi:hypothetical protein
MLISTIQICTAFVKLHEPSRPDTLPYLSTRPRTFHFILTPHDKSPSIVTTDFNLRLFYELRDPAEFDIIQTWE